MIDYYVKTMNVKVHVILLQICQSARKFSRLVAFLKARKVRGNSRSVSLS